MTFPVIPTGSAILTTLQADTTATRTFPAFSGLTYSVGDRLVAIAIAYQSTASAGAVWSGWNNGFTEVADVGNSVMTIGVASKVADGTESGSLTVTQAATITGFAVLIIMTVADGSTISAPETTAIATGTTSAADPASLSPSWGSADTLWIAVAGWGETSTTGTFTNATASPTNYGSDVIQNASGTKSVGNTGGGVGFRQNTAASENASTWSGIDTSNARNSALVIAVRPSSTIQISVADSAATNEFTQIARTIGLSLVEPYGLTAGSSAVTISTPKDSAATNESVTVKVADPKVAVTDAAASAEFSNVQVGASTDRTVNVADTSATSESLLVREGFVVGLSLVEPYNLSVFGDVLISTPKDSSATSEFVKVNLPGYTFQVSVADTAATAEFSNVGIAGAVLQINVADTSAASEDFLVGIPPVISDTLTVSVSDGATTAESSIVKTADPQVPASDTGVTAESSSAKVADPRVAVADTASLSESTTGSTSAPQIAVTDSTASHETTVAAITAAGSILINVQDTSAVSETTSTTTAGPRIAVTDSTVSAESATVHIQVAGSPPNTHPPLGGTYNAGSDGGTTNSGGTGGSIAAPERGGTVTRSITGGSTNSTPTGGRFVKWTRGGDVILPVEGGTVE